MTTLQFYTDQAADCRRAAELATLENVRQRNLTAADAWDAMAHRVSRAKEQRVANEEAKWLAREDVTGSVLD